MITSNHILVNLSLWCPQVTLVECASRVRKKEGILDGSRGKQMSETKGDFNHCCLNDGPQSQMLAHHFLLVKESPQILTICCHLKCCTKPASFVVQSSTICTPSKTSTCLPLGRDIKGTRIISQITKNRQRSDPWVKKKLLGVFDSVFWPQYANRNDKTYAFVEKLSSLWKIMDHSWIQSVVWSYLIRWCHCIL